MKFLSILALTLAACSVSSSSIQRESQNEQKEARVLVETSCPNGDSRQNFLPNRGDYVIIRNDGLFDNTQCSTIIGSAGFGLKFRCSMRMNEGSTFRVYSAFDEYYFFACASKVCYKRIEMIVNFVATLNQFTAGSGWGGGFVCEIIHTLEEPTNTTLVEYDS